MNIIPMQPNESGAYLPVQSWDGATPPDGYLEVAEGVTLTHGGFGTLTIENDVATAFTPDEAAWEAWQAEHPAPEPQDPLTLSDVAEAMIDLQVEMINLKMGVN